jgi:hypothetical protein
MTEAQLRVSMDDLEGLIEPTLSDDFRISD